MIQQTLRRWLPGRAIVAMMDGEFAALELLHALRPLMVVITRMRKDAGLFEPPPCHDDKLGRAPREGRRQPLLSARIPDPTTRWQRVVQSSRTFWRNAGWIEYAHGTALWHHGGKPIVPLLWAEQSKVPRATRVEGLWRASKPHTKKLVLRLAMSSAPPKVSSSLAA